MYKKIALNVTSEVLSVMLGYSNNEVDEQDVTEVMKQVTFLPKHKSQLFKVSSWLPSEGVAQLSELMATVLY